MKIIKIRRELKKPTISTIFRDSQGNYRQHFTISDGNGVRDAEIKAFINFFNAQNPQEPQKTGEKTETRNAAEHGHTNGRTENVHVKVGYAQKFETAFKGKFTPQ